jgi:nucleotide-binding universal stress UspA family protein
MATKTKNKALITLDGSKRSLQTAVYASQLRPLQDMEINLFHVFDAIPDNYWDLDFNNQVIRSTGQLRAWEAQWKKNIQDQMVQAQKIMLAAGFKSENIKITIRNRKKGIARDIIKEAKQGYQLLITRRRGMGAIRSLIVGSVTAKLLDTLNTIPILLAGQQPPGNKFLLAIDGSEGAKRALDFAATFLNGYGYQIGLVHVIRGGANFISSDMPMPLFIPEPFMQEALDNSQDILQTAKQQLIAAGIKKQHISTKTITGVTSRTAAIVEEAKTGEYGTILLGRRGLSSTKEFVMGRVAKKIIYLGRKHSVWIIS